MRTASFWEKYPGVVVIRLYELANILKSTLSYTCKK
jgi:hypothetical protein